MNRHLIRPALRGLVLALAVTALSSYVARAVPYASGISNNGNTVYFTLNQDADGLVVLRDGANPVSPGTTKGVHSFDMTGYTTYSIIVTGNTAVAWAQFSDDSLTQSKYYSPRGVAVDTNPKRSTFGQIIVAEALGGSVAAGGRTTTDGLYIMSADQGDIWGQGDTAFAGGIDWTTGGSSSPWKISLNRNDPSGQDYTIYIGDWSDGHSGIWTADLLNPTTTFNELLDNTGRDPAGIVLENSGAGPGQLHGSVPVGPWVEGTGASRIMYTVDEDVGLGNVWQYDIGTTTSGYSTAPIARVTDTLGYVLNANADLVRAADGSWWMAQYRYTDSDSVPSLLHWADNSSAPSWTSGPSTIPLDRGYGMLDIYEPEDKLVLGSNNGLFYVLGISDPNNPVLLDTVSHSGATLRDVAFDAAGNIYVVSSSSETLRIYSPGGLTEATTSSDGTFSLVRPTTINVSVTASPNVTSMDTTQPPGVFTLTRTGSTASPLTVDYTLTGTATNGTHYVTLPTSVTFDVGATATNLNVTAIPGPAGPTRSVVLGISPSGGGAYTPYPPNEATVWIVDTNTPTIVVARRDAQMYERTNDYARFTVTRWGDTNAYIYQVNMSYGGTAVPGTQIYVDYTNTAFSFNPGEVTHTVYVYALHDGVVTGPLTVTANVEPMTPGFGDYVVGTPGTSVDAVTRVDSDYPPETILWQDNLQTDTSANWTQRFATANGAAYDATVTWAFDYSGPPWYVVPAPHSGGDTHGLYMTVNNVNAVAAGVNLYPNGQSFSGNYAFRFDMFLGMAGGSLSTQYGLYGINHSGSKTNWFRSSGDGVDPTGWDYDGVFFCVEADGTGYDYLTAWSAPATAPPVVDPTALATGDAAALAGVFKAPPYVYTSVPANASGTGTPMWTDVSIEQIDGVIYWYINHTLIFAYTNTTGFGSGNVMLGYCDPFDSISDPTAAVIFANARVVELPASLAITDISVVGGNVEITFKANSSDTTADFVLQESSPSVTGAYGDTASTISSLGGGVFKATKAVPAAQTFYRVRRLP